MVRSADLSLWKKYIDKKGFSIDGQFLLKYWSYACLIPFKACVYTGHDIQLYFHVTWIEFKGKLCCEKNANLQ